MRRSWTKSLIFVVCALVGCQRPSPSHASDSPNPAVTGGSDTDAIPRSRDADDTARFLAGLPGRAGSRFAALEADTAWQEHRRQMDDAWNSANQKLVIGLRSFQERELNIRPLDRAVVFYPFSGPDALTVTTCFPLSPRYVLVALEPAGTLPSLDHLSEKQLPLYLGGVRSSMASVLGKSFFVTREMDRQFRGQITDGLLVPTLLLLARTEHTILGMKYVRINEAGEVADRPGGVPVEAEHANKGFAIEFRTDADQSVHKLYYFSLNLANPKLKGNAGFLQYVRSLPSPTTMMKATSYMPHHPEFSIIRDLIVSQSGAVFQDDSGVPYHFFGNDQWKVQLYGEYTHPYGSFRWLEQGDLRKAYMAGGARPLTLRLGYGFGRVTSNLLLAIRVQK